MNRPFTPFHKILIPIVYGCDSDASLAIAEAILGEGKLAALGLVGVPAGESLSAAAQAARSVRQTLNQLGSRFGERLRAQSRVRVSHEPWSELLAIIKDERPDLLLLEWPRHLEALNVSAEALLAHPPCDLAFVRGPVPAAPERILTAVRGGPHAELALRLALGAAPRRSRSSITSLHIGPDDTEDKRDTPFMGLRQVLRGMPEVKRREATTGDPAETILAEAAAFDLLVMGASARPQLPHALGEVTDRVLAESSAGVVVVKTKRSMPAEIEGPAAGAEAISILVDRWFAENTFDADEFADLDQLVRLKRQQGLTVSLALPALNEEETVGTVIESVQKHLVREAPLLDEIVLIDSQSTDATRQIARDLGVPVFVHQELLPEQGSRPGKGEALWKSLYVTRGDLVIWVDTDIANFHPRFVYGILGPLLATSRIQFVKGFYRRPLKVGDRMQAGGGGRVTELTARPLLNLFYPELSGVVQPLSGEYGGRRSVLETLPFFSGYGVETGLLIDVFERQGLSAIAQVDLLERVHHNQPLDALSKMSFAIIQSVIRKIEGRYDRPILDDVNKTMKLIRYGAEGYWLDVEEIAEKERPPIASLPGYQQRPAASAGLIGGG